MTAWGDVAARARGMSTHLLRYDELCALARLPDVAAVGEALAARGLLPRPEADPVAIERGLRHRRGDRLALLWRWCGTRVALASVVVDDEDRRSLVRILRHAAHGGETLAGLVTTPSLPEALLGALVEQRDPRSVAALLAAWEHPLAAGLLDADGLVGMERALHIAFARRVSRAARRGDAALRAFVGTILDVENALQAVLQSRQPPETRDLAAWLPGGARLGRRTWSRLLSGDDDARAVLLPCLGSDLAEAILAEPAAEAELRVLRALVVAHARAARRSPISTAPVLALLLRQRAEAWDLRAILWGRSLGVPADAIERRFVTPGRP